MLSGILSIDNTVLRLKYDCLNFETTSKFESRERLVGGGTTIMTSRIRSSGWFGLCY